MLFVMPLHSIEAVVLIWKLGAGGTGVGPLVPANAVIPPNATRTAKTQSSFVPIMVIFVFISIIFLRYSV
jgi:hypothetical protein